MEPRVMLHLPRTARRGQVVEIRTLIAHPMESGFRPDAGGSLVPRDIIRGFRCTWNGEVVMEAELFPAIAANPFLSFRTIATESGVVRFEWTDDQGRVRVEESRIEVV